MLKDRFKGYIVVEYKWVLLSRLMALCLFVIIGYILVNAITGLSKPANADYLPDNNQSSSGGVRIEGVKPVVMKWMKDNSEMPEYILSNIYDEAAKYAHSDLILAICAVESNFNPGAKSKKGAVGLMGILPKIWLDELKSRGIVQGKRDLYEISNNIASGVHVLGKYLLRANNLEQALFDYVGGDSNYVNKVLRALGEIYLARMLKRS